MTKKIAMSLAALVAAAFLTGLVMFSNLTGAKGAPEAAARPKPVVKTVQKIVTVTKHRPAPAGAALPRTVVVPAAPAAASSFDEDHAEDEADDDAFDDRGADASDAQEDHSAHGGGDDD
jgi:hypothetical protein